jgi:hypothetical protein
MFKLSSVPRPGFELIEHRARRFTMARRRSELGKVLEIGVQQEGKLLADVCDLQFAADRPQVLDRPGAAE